MTAPSLETAFRRASPRLNPQPIAPLGAAIMTAIVLFWLAAFVSAFRSHGLAAWSIGVAFIFYDLAHLVFIGVQARKLFAAAPASAAAAPVSVGVVVAAYNEAAALGPTLDALLAQTSPPDQITPRRRRLRRRQRRRARGALRLWLARRSAGRRGARWRRRSIGCACRIAAKRATLNAALDQVATEVVVTVDADTRLAPDAIADIRPPSPPTRSWSSAAACWSRAVAAAPWPSRCRRSSASNISEISSPASRGRSWRRCC